MPFDTSGQNVGDKKVFVLCFAICGIATDMIAEVPIPCCPQRERRRMARIRDKIRDEFDIGSRISVTRRGG